MGRTTKSNFCVKDASVSEKHGEIAFDASAVRWTITDKDSSNGTQVNGVQCEPGGRFSLLVPYR